MSYDFLLTIAIIMLFTKVFGLTSERVHMPQVVGALIAGCLLYTSVLLFGQTERITFNISCQAYAARRCQTGKTAVNLKHTHFCSPSILRISSRSLAARS